MSDLGKVLKEERERQGKDISEVSKETHISKAAIMTIEEGRFSELPSYVHCLGFVKKYADFLGIDFEEIKELFNAECKKKDFSPGENHEMERVDYNIGEKNTKTVGIVIFLIIVLLAGGLTYFFVFSDSSKNILPKSAGTNQKEAIVDEDTISDNNSEKNTDTQPSETDLTHEKTERNGEQPIGNSSHNFSGNIMNNATENMHVSVKNNMVEQESEITPYEIANELNPKKEQEKEIYTVNLEFSDTCWVHVDIDGERQLDFIAGKGLIKSINFSDYFLIDIGNAAAITISYGDDVFSHLGGYREPVKNLKFIMDNGSLTYSKINN